MPNDKNERTDASFAKDDLLDFKEGFKELYFTAMTACDEATKDDFYLTANDARRWIFAKAESFLADFQYLRTA